MRHSNLQVGIIGAGSVGGYYGALIAKAGYQVHFGVNKSYDLMAKNGLVVESVVESFHLPKVSVFQSIDAMPPLDLAIVALKTTENHLLEQKLKPLVKKGGTIVILQNGIGNEATISSWVPDAHVFGGVCFIGVEKKSPYEIKHTFSEEIALGGGKAILASEEEGALKNLKEIFDQSRIRYKVIEDLQRKRWEKLLWNIPFNGLSVVLNSPIGPMTKHAPSRSLLERLMKEVIAAAGACGHEFGSDMIEKMIHSCDTIPDFRPSMLQDHHAGRRMEIEYICENPMKLAEEAGFQMPLVQMLAEQLYFIQGKQSLLGMNEASQPT